MASKFNLNPGDVDKSLAWYKNQIRSLAASKKSPSSLMSGSQDLTNNILPGYMYMFFYDPKWKDVLPYYDRFPLILPFNKTGEGFYGLNLHYLPHGARFSILDALQNVMNKNEISETSKMKLSWSLLTSISKDQFVKASVKQYLMSNVQSKFLRIHPVDWKMVSVLPTEMFEGANKTTVWRNSLG